jgi:hypothetical protein
MASKMLCATHPKCIFQYFDSIMLGERHIRHAKVSKKNSFSILFYDNCVGDLFFFFFFFFSPPPPPPQMTSTKCSPQLNGNTIFTFCYAISNTCNEWQTWNCVPMLLYTPLCVPNGFHMFLNPKTCPWM